MHVNLNLYSHGKSSVKLKSKLKLITTAIHDCRLGIRYISYLDISLIKTIKRCTIFFKLVGKLFHNIPSCKRSFVSIKSVVLGLGRVSFPSEFPYIVSRVMLR